MRCLNEQDESSSPLWESRFKVSIEVTAEKLAENLKKASEIYAYDKSCLYSYAYNRT